MASFTAEPEILVLAPIKVDAGLRGGVVNRLLKAIFRGKLKEGHRLITQKLAAELGVSVTPVREALFELYHLGMLDIHPNRGATCRRFTRIELREIYEIRILLETQAVRIACPLLDAEALLALRDQMIELQETEVTQAWWARAYELDCQLHTMIIDACGNNRLEFELQRMATLMLGIYRSAGVEYDTDHLQVTEHLKILDALIARDGEQAAEKMSRHIHRTCEGIEAVLFGQPQWVGKSV